MVLDEGGALAVGRFHEPFRIALGETALAHDDGDAVILRRHQSDANVVAGASKRPAPRPTITQLPCTPNDRIVCVK